ncbi:MAG: tetratricopeptide repeat protein, partial [Candidatus Latescibacterota bacterium]
ARAMTEYNARNNETAAVAFAQLADRYGGHPAGKVARYFLGKAYLANEQYEQALEAFEGYLNTAGEDPEFGVAATVGMALAYEGLEDFGAAAKLLEQLSQTMDPEDPRYVEVVFLAARNFEKTNSRETAIELYTIVNDTATGELKDRAAVWIAILE